MRRKIIFLFEKQFKRKYKKDRYLFQCTSYFSIYLYLFLIEIKLFNSYDNYSCQFWICSIFMDYRYLIICINKYL